MSRVPLGGVVVTFRPDENVRVNLQALLGQLDHLVIVDNEATSTSRHLLAAFVGDPRVSLINNPGNLGLARALNQGIERALELGCEWVATFDQDSRVPPGHIAGLLTELAAYDGAASVGILAPVYRDVHLGFVFSPASKLPPGRDVRIVPVANTSGCLVRATTIRRVGAMRAEFFIDCVDFEFCLRARRGGWMVLEAPRVVLDHEQGRWSRHQLLGWRTQMNDYPANRRYYQMRNRLATWSRHLAFDPAWCVADAWGFARELIKFFLFAEGRRGKLGAMIQGAWHALIGRGGPRPVG